MALLKTPIVPFDPSSLSPEEEAEKAGLLSVLERDGRIVRRQHAWATFAPLLACVALFVLLVVLVLVLRPIVQDAQWFQAPSGTAPATGTTQAPIHVFATDPDAVQGDPQASVPVVTIGVIDTTKLPEMGGDTAWLELLLLAGVSLLAYGWWLSLIYRNRYLVITPERIITNTAVLSRNEQQLPISRLSDSSYFQPVSSRLLCALSRALGRSELYWAWADDFGIDTQGSRANGYFDKVGSPRVIMAVVYELLARHTPTGPTTNDLLTEQNRLLAQLVDTLTPGQAVRQSTAPVITELVSPADPAIDYTRPIPPTEI